MWPPRSAPSVPPTSIPTGADMNRLICRVLRHDVDAMTGTCHRCGAQMLDPLDAS